MYQMPDWSSAAVIRRKTSATFIAAARVQPRLERQAEEFARNLWVGPFGVLVTNARFLQFPDKSTHL